MAWYDDINFTGLAAAGLGAADQLKRYDDMSATIKEGSADIAQTATEATAFQPFSVTSYGGQTSVGENGSVEMNLDEAAANRATTLGGQADSFYASASGDQTEREQNIYDKIRAMQKPGEERAYTDMESRLAAQGRMGMSSSQYGGSPEQHAFGLAQAEARNNAAYQSIEQARAQQAQDMDLAGAAHTGSWLDTAQMGNMANLGFQGATLNQGSQFAGAQLGAQAGLTGLEAQINNEKIRADMMGGLFNSVGQASQGPDGKDWLGEILGGIFG